VIEWLHDIDLRALTRQYMLGLKTFVNGHAIVYQRWSNKSLPPQIVSKL
jgi:hypothetical protein